MARDLLREADELDRHLAALGIRVGTSAGSGTSRPSGPVRTASADEVAAAVEQIHDLVERLAELQGRLQALRGLKERLDRPRAQRTPER